MSALQLERCLNELNESIDKGHNECIDNVDAYEMYFDTMDEVRKTLDEILKMKKCKCQSVPLVVESKEKEKPKEKAKIDKSKGKLEISHSLDFKANSAKLQGKETMMVLDEVATLCKQFNVKIVIEGHTSKSKKMTQEKLKFLSVQRAESVRKALIERGVPSENMKAVGCGSLKPPSDPTVASKRVDFLVSDYGTYAG